MQAVAAVKPPCVRMVQISLLFPRSFVRYWNGIAVIGVVMGKILEKEAAICLAYHVGGHSQ